MAVTPSLVARAVVSRRYRPVMLEFVPLGRRERAGVPVDGAGRQTGEVRGVVGSAGDADAGGASADVSRIQAGEIEPEPVKLEAVMLPVKVLLGAVSVGTIVVSMAIVPVVVIGFGVPVRPVPAVMLVTVPPES